MTTAVRPHARTAAARTTTDGARPADVLVVFGITGDLAKVMTFRSLYRLEQRGPARLPDRRRRGRRLDRRPTCASARASRSSAAGEPLDEDVFERLAARLSYVQGDFADAATYERVARRDRRRAHAGLLPRDPAVPVRPVVEGLADAGLTDERAGRGREAVRPRPRVGAGARPTSSTSTSTSPSSTGSTTSSGRWASAEILYLRFANIDARAGLEPPATSRRSRSRWPRTSASRTAATSTTRSARCATSSSTT